MRSSKFRAIAVSGLTVLALALSACGGGDSGGAAQGAADGEPQQGGVLKFSMQADGGDLDPAHSSPSPVGWGNLMYPIFDTLVRVDDEGNVEPRIATDVTTEDGGLTWTIVLRPGVEFSDGTPFNAEAVRINWERYRLPESVAAADAKQLAEIAVVDDTTLTAKLVAPNNGFPYLLQTGLGMIGSPTAIESMGDQYSVSPVAAGPFMVADRVTGSKTTYERNPSYWDAPGPYLDGIEISIIPEATQAARTLQAGQLDVATGLPPDVMGQLEGAGGIETTRVPSMGGYAFWMNSGKAPTDDVRIRRALYLAIDPEVANEQVAQGEAEVITNIFPEDSPYYVPEGDLPWNGDAAEAQELIDSYVAEHGGPVSIELLWLTGTPQWPQAFAQQVDEKLDDITINVLPATAAEIGARLYDASYDMLFNVMQGADPVTVMFERLHCESARNSLGYCNPEMDAALEEARQATTTEDRVAALARAQEIFVEDVPLLWQSRSNQAAGWRSEVGGVEFFGTGYLAVERAWIAN
jgi:peptide/nickel transport system substrate-binding protein